MPSFLVTILYREAQLPIFSDLSQLYENFIADPVFRIVRRIQPLVRSNIGDVHKAFFLVHSYEHTEILNAYDAATVDRS